MRKTKKQKVLAEKRRVETVSRVFENVGEQPNLNNPQPLKLDRFLDQKSLKSQEEKGAMLVETGDYSYLKKDLTKIAILSISAFVVQVLIYIVLRMT